MLIRSLSSKQMTCELCWPQLPQQTINSPRLSDRKDRYFGRKIPPTTHNSLFGLYISITWQYWTTIIAAIPHNIMFGKHHSLQPSYIHVLAISYGNSPWSQHWWWFWYLLAACLRTWQRQCLQSLASPQRWPPTLHHAKQQCPGNSK